MELWVLHENFRRNVVLDLAHRTRATTGIAPRFF